MKKALLAGLTISLGLGLASPYASSAESLYSRVMPYVIQGQISVNPISDNTKFGESDAVRKTIYHLPNGIEVITTQGISYKQTGFVSTDFMLLPNLYLFKEKREIGFKEELWEDFNQDGLNGNEERIFPERDNWRINYANAISLED